jgi:type I restriction enzyme S subunit
MVSNELEGALFNYHIIRLRLDPELVEPKFVMFLLRGSLDVKEYLDDVARGATRDGVNTALLKKLPVAVPPLDEQRRIVAKIDALSAHSKQAKADLDRVEALAARAKQAVLAAAYRGDLVHGARSSWQPRPLSEGVTELRYGTAQKCGPSGGVPVLRIPNVVSGVVDLSDLKYADFDKQEVSKLALQIGDILMVRSNGSVSLVGRSALVDQSAAGMLFAGYLIRLRVNRSQVDPRFLHMMLASPDLRLAIEREAKSTSGVNNINSRQIEALQVPLPHLDEQLATVARAETLLQKIDVTVKEATSAATLLDRLDQSILAKAFRGELVRQDPAEEPASILFDRIRAERAGTETHKRRGRTMRASG